MFSRTALVVACTTLLSQGLASVPSTAATALTVQPAQGPVKIIGHTYGSSLAMDSDGNTTVVWATNSTPHKIMAMRHPAGRHWGEPVVIGRGQSPLAEADSRGRVTVAWVTKRKGFSQGLAAARRSVAGTWSDPVALSNDRRLPADPHGQEAGVYWSDLAVSSTGAAVVVWDWGSTPGEDLRVRAAYRPAGGSWGEQTSLTRASGTDDPQVGMDGHGSVVLAYEIHGALKSRRLDEKGWTKPVKVAAHSYRHELAVDDAGNALLVFAPDLNGKIRSAFRPAAGPWGAPQDVSTPGVEVDEFTMAMNGAGAAVVGYTHGNGRIDVVDRPAGGSWSTPAQMARSRENSYFVRAAINEAGGTFLGWGFYGLFGKYRPASGTWSHRFTIRPDAEQLADVIEAAEAAVTPSGRTVVLWNQEESPLKVRIIAAP